MSCNNCQSNRHVTDECYEARLSLGLSPDEASIIGSLDGIYIKPIPLRSAIRKNETNTTLKYNPVTRTLIYENERFKNGQGVADIIPAGQLLSGVNLSDLGGVLPLVNGGLASAAIVDGQLVQRFEVPVPVEQGESAAGFVTYVPNPNNGVSHYRLIRPDITGDVDTLLVGHPDGSVEFVSPINSPLLVPIDSLTGSGVFSGTPGVTSGSWRYQQMGQSQVITNNSGSKVEVTLELRWSMQTTGSRSGFYAELVDGGSDFQDEFVDGGSNTKQEGYPGGQGRWTAILEPNQRCQFRFGGWTNQSGNMEITLGSVSESAGTTVQQVRQPIIHVRRLI